MYKNNLITVCINITSLTLVWCPEHESVEEEEVPEILEQSHEEEIESVTFVDEVPFPSPSLRRIIPDRIRKIEKQNRIHVLPEVFRTKINPEDIPRVRFFYDFLRIYLGS